jgi:hypothetical protein
VLSASFYSLGISRGTSAAELHFCSWKSWFRSPAATAPACSPRPHHPRCTTPSRRQLAAAQSPTQAHTRSLPQAPRTTATASSSYRNSTAFIWHSSGDRYLPRRPPALKTQQPLKSVIPTQKRVTEQLTKHWAPFKVLRQRYACTHFEEQLQLHLPQKHKATVPDSTLRVEMNNLEEQADNAKDRELFWKPLSWLGAIKPTSANDAFDPALWETFVSTLPPSHASIIARLLSEAAKSSVWTLTATTLARAHSGATKAHD